MEKLVPTAGHDHNSFDAVGIIKRTTDTQDNRKLEPEWWVRLCLQKLKEDGRDGSPDGCRRSREYFAAGKCLFWCNTHKGIWFQNIRNVAHSPCYEVDP